MPEGESKRAPRMASRERIHTVYFCLFHPPLRVYKAGVSISNIS